MSPQLGAGLRHAERGWLSLPLKPRNKLPLLKNWPSTASCDLATLREWFPEGTERNIGILTGEKSGLIVIDVDLRNGGEASFARMEAEFGALPKTARVTTGSGGFHLYLLLALRGSMTPIFRASIRGSISRRRVISLRHRAYTPSPDGRMSGISKDRLRRPLTGSLTQFESASHLGGPALA